MNLTNPIPPSSTPENGRAMPFAAEAGAVASNPPAGGGVRFQAIVENVLPPKHSHLDCMEG